jgi:hypothetical protein
MKKQIIASGKPSAALTLFLFMIIGSWMVFFLSCGGKKEEGEKQVDGISGPFYRFIPGSDGRIEKAEKVEIPSGMDPRGVLKILGEDLARTYFSEDPSGEKTGIGFETLTISAIESPDRTYRLAVINMKDPNQAALHYFFQGSYGARETFYMITATLLQPQNQPPLLDGLILQYNGGTFPELDHINFSGIMVPGAVSPMVKSAVYRSFEHP